MKLVDKGFTGLCLEIELGKKTEKSLLPADSLKIMPTLSRAPYVSLWRDRLFKVSHTFLSNCGLSTTWEEK